MGNYIDIYRVVYRAFYRDNYRAVNYIGVRMTNYRAFLVY